MLNNEETLNLDQETIFLKENVSISWSENLIFSSPDKIQHSIACSEQNSSGQLSQSLKSLELNHILKYLIRHQEQED